MECKYNPETKTYNKPYDVQYHIFTNVHDEYCIDLEEAIQIAEEFFKDFGCVRIYKDTEWNERDGIFEDGDCIFSLGEYPY